MFEVYFVKVKVLKKTGIIYLKNVDNSIDNDYHYRILLLFRDEPLRLLE